MEKVEKVNAWQIIQDRDKLREIRAALVKLFESWPVIDLEELRSLKNNAANYEPFYGQGLKNDAFGFMDILAIDPVEGVIAVQSTGPSGHSEHKLKILRNDYALRWAHFNKIELISWKKKPQKEGSKRLVWMPRMEVITLEMFIEFAKKDNE